MSKTAYLVFDNHPYKKKDIITSNGIIKYEVIRTYNNWWYRFLKWLGFNINLNKIKVKIWDGIID